MESTTPTDASSAGSRATLRTGLAAAAVLVLVAALVAVVYAAVSLRPRIESSTDDQRTRSEVTQAAERFTVQFNTYDAASVDQYRSSLRTMLSPKFKASFDREFDQSSQLITQSKLSSKGEVLASGVSSVDPDSAQVLVVADANASSSFEGKVTRHFRWEVSLVRIDDTWLVDDYQAVS